MSCLCFVVLRFTSALRKEGKQDGPGRCLHFMWLWRLVVGEACACFTKKTYGVQQRAVAAASSLLSLGRQWRPHQAPRSQNSRRCVSLQLPRPIACRPRRRAIFERVAQALIKKLMQADPEVGRVSASALELIGNCPA